MAHDYDANNDYSDLYITPWEECAKHHRSLRMEEDEGHSVLASADPHGDALWEILPEEDEELWAEEREQEARDATIWEAACETLEARCTVQRAEERIVLQGSSMRPTDRDTQATRQDIISLSRTIEDLAAAFRLQAWLYERWSMPKEAAVCSALEAAASAAATELDMKKETPEVLEERLIHTLKDGNTLEYRIQRCFEDAVGGGKLKMDDEEGTDLVPPISSTLTDPTW